MTLLTIATSARQRVLQKTPTSVTGEAADTSIIAMKELATQAGRDLVRRHDWTDLIKEQTFTSLAQEEQTGMLPTDLDRFIDETWFNRSKTRRILGPLSEREWQRRKTLATSPVFESFRLRGGEIIMIPTPEAGDTLAFEYISNLWVDQNGGTTWDATSFMSDTETCVFDDELMVQSVVWRYLQTHGLDYAEAFRNYEMTLLDAIARDGGNRTINFSGSAGSQPRVPHIPEGSWTI